MLRWLRTGDSGARAFVQGILIGIALVALGAGIFFKKDAIKAQFKSLSKMPKSIRLPEFLKFSSYRNKIVADFNQPLPVQNGKSFGPKDAFTFELFRNGTFIIDGQGYAWQKSDSYRDSAFIRSTNPLPKKYKITVTFGEVDYGLEKIEGLKKDPEYPEGPENENGVYLLAITDEIPQGHHTNIWWHQHRNVVIDIDNNVWGHGGPNPIFMVYFNEDNRLRAFDGAEDEWKKEWVSALRYEPTKFYKAEVEKTGTHYILRIYDKDGRLLKEGQVAIKDGVWHGEGNYDEYLVVGDPHENYYQGSFKIDEIVLEF